MRRSVRLPKLPILATALVALLLVVISSSLPAQQVASQAGSDYVDSQVCAACHQQIYQDYMRTGMGRSFFRPSPSNTLEDYTKPDYYHALSDTHYSMVRRGGEYFQRRWQIGFDGKETNVEETKIDYVMGSGNHARSYLHRTDRGTLIELPLGWYSRQSEPGGGAGSWGMVPGSDSDHPRTRRFVSYKCMFCHNGIPQIPADNNAPGSDPVFTGAMPEGIDCQRCHGPGGKHVQTVASAKATVADIRASIVNPARLSVKLQMETCMQCHLETTSGRIPASIVRFDRGPFSFVPGQPLEAFMLTFDHAPGTGHDDKFEAVSSFYRLRQSQCFLKSAGKLTCETCHDPHRIPRGADAVAHYSGVCLQCHSSTQGSIAPISSLIAAGKHSASTDCIACHMPKRRAEDTPGMIMTDHLIQRRPALIQGQARDLLAEFRERTPEEYHGEVVPYYPSPLPPTPASALYRAVAQVGNNNNVAAGLPVLASEIDRQKPKEFEFYIVLGDGWISAGKPREAVAAYERAAQLKPDSASVLRSLASGLSAAGEPARAAETLAHALRIAPTDPVTWYNYGMLDFDAGRTADAAEKVRKAIALDPSLPGQSRSLAEILLKAGQRDPAQTALADALRTDPYDDGAWDLAGRVVAEKGEMAEALYDFGKATRLSPRDASHLYDYALTLARMNRMDEAKQQAESALSADPNLPDAHELLGGIFEKQNSLPDAIREYRRVLELHPEMSRVHFELGSVLARQRDFTGAAEEMRAAAKSDDAAIARQAAQALQQMGIGK